MMQKLVQPATYLIVLEVLLQLVARINRNRGCGNRCEQRQKSRRGKHIEYCLGHGRECIANEGLEFFFMLGKVQRISLAGEHDDEATTHSERPLLDEQATQATDQMLLAVAELEFQEDLIRQRELGINSIQRDVNTIHGLFQDVAMHVSSQGHMLDNIEANVTAASDQTREANTELDRANRRAPSTRRNIMCILMVVFMIIILLAMLRDLFFPHILARSGQLRSLIKTV
jgi:multidrug efflux pump subunit AcrA (membrane-fusion protein)